ncbi:type II secretion system F family protein [Microcystis aeruginosa]|jgi:type IV pilus assembly protein PilC|uniref:Type II secretion system F family protein n=2 Tax=Microcystis TaxID=1125 RepID=A0A552HWC1_MICVR|nr:type II secretion system F family protein [Microcystis aeruginosa]NCR09402.1 type II secretion system F family protein [Microcystis aeruginosa LG13-11]TRU70268.1 MAG: type II secretion system F family protein [Microcystis viridis Mv_BB_P_19951000_S68]TRU75523.1 MAG: type II secretion system F family protein [Microcystis viridis Mv_BB_P_19951000_S68D]TRU76123.1 MAG: type II secretion system F family protein [Microcystis viridis Mv_BB_P_19951000_S69]TRU81787.1 MAG: type II secretion system F 
MPTFVAQVKSSSGKVFQEKVEAMSPEQARMMLKAKYAAVGKVKKAVGEIDLSGLKLMFTSISIKDKAVFSRQFSVMINAGVAIVRCLGVLGDQCGNLKMKKALQAISAEVQQGSPLSEAMAKHPECFDELYVSMVEAGETGGVLDEVLNRLSKLLEDMARLKNQIKSAMTYPVAVGILAVIVFFGMTIFLIPVFAKIFIDLKVPLPALTQFMLFLSSVMRSWLILIPIVTIAATVFLLRRYYKTPIGRLQIDHFFLKMPLFGDLNEKSAVARFCRVFGTLTRSGVPILSSLDIVSNTVGNQVIANAIAGAKAEIQQGGMMSLALQKANVFPPLAIQMISIGEETGELDAMMMKVADFYEDEVEQAVKALTSIIEPLMMVGVAGMVGIILLSMYLPMFKIFDALG